MRPACEIDRKDLAAYIATLEKIIKRFSEKNDAPALTQARQSERIARWCWDTIQRQPPDAAPEAVPVPESLRETTAVLRYTKKARKEGRKALKQALYRLMRKDPDRTVRNVASDLSRLVRRANGRTCFATSSGILFHLTVKIPKDKRVSVLDATANEDLLQPIFGTRPVVVLCNERVLPAGRIFQFMDFNGPRSYLNKLPPKAITILDAIGDLHPAGAIVLIGQLSNVDGFAKASKHKNRIKVAHFGDLRGRNDLENSANNPIACHIVIGSPRTTETARQQLALAVFGKEILPFPEMKTVRRTVIGKVPEEMAEHDNERRIWEIKYRAYTDPRMQAVYEHTVTSELIHAADRARVLKHKDTVVYLVTNEPVPKLWFAELCYASDLLDLSTDKRQDFKTAYATYEAKTRELLDAGRCVCNADICRALGWEKPGRGKRYWQQFVKENDDVLEGERKRQWKHRGDEVPEQQGWTDPNPSQRQGKLENMGDMDNPTRPYGHGEDA
jgi:hypothetical protein